MTKEKTSPGPTPPSELVMQQRLTYGDLVTARRHASLRSASIKEKWAYQLMLQRRNKRAEDIRRTFRVVGE